MVVAYQVRRVLELRKSDAVDHQMFIIVPSPCELFLSTTLSHLDEGPCNMGESQDEPSVEVGKSQKAPKLS
jgi:hypothetical protein